MKYYNNGFGVSVISNGYGQDKGLLELAVTTVDGIHYNNEVAQGDVVGFLTIEEVCKLTKQVKQFAKYVNDDDIYYNVDGTTTGKDNNMKITIDISIEEIKAMRETTKVDYGYTVDQYDATELDNTTMVEVYKGFKIYHNTYYRWYKDSGFNSRTPLVDTIDECKAQIDDYIIRKDI